LNLNGPIDLNGSVLSFVWDASVPSTTINGVISGAGGLSIDGTGGDIGLTLFGDNTFTGPVIVNSGYLAVFHANALGAAGSAPDGTTVHGNGTLVVGADMSNEFLTLEGGGGQSGNGQMQARGNRTWGGPVFIDTVDGAQSNFNLLGNHINFSGVVSGPGGFYCCNQVAGTIVLGNSGNTYAGLSNFINTGGTLQLLADNALSPNSAIDLSGSSGGILDMGGFSGAVAGFTGIAGAHLKIVAGQTLTVSGPVALNDTTLDLSVGNPPIGTTYKIVDNTGAGAIAGTFNGLAEGATVTVGAIGMKISYAGSTGNDVTLTVQSDGVNAAVDVVRTGSGTGTVTADSGAIDCGATCSGPYVTGVVLKLAATPSAGSQFTGWVGPCSGTGACEFTVNGPTTVSATFASNSIGTPSLDIDATGSCDALTDGVLIARYLTGLSGAALINGAIGPAAGRATASAVGDYLIDIRPILDVDGNGQVDAATDGLLVLRYLFGFRGASLIADALGTGASPGTAAAVQSQIQSRCPPCAGPPVTP